MISTEDKQQLQTLRNGLKTLAELNESASAGSERTQELSILKEIAQTAQSVSFECRASYAGVPWKDLLAVKRALAAEAKQSTPSDHIITHFNAAELVQQLNSILQREASS